MNSRIAASDLFILVTVTTVTMNAEDGENGFYEPEKKKNEFLDPLHSCSGFLWFLSRVTGVPRSKRPTCSTAWGPLNPRRKKG